MGYTSTEVKKRYNAKTYKRWSLDLKFKDFDRIEELRGDRSRAEFLKMLVAKYADELAESKTNDKITKTEEQE